MELYNYFIETAFNEMYEFEHKEDWSKVDLVRMLRNAYMALRIYKRELREQEVKQDEETFNDSFIDSINYFGNNRV